MEVLLVFCRTNVLLSSLLLLPFLLGADKPLTVSWSKDLANAHAEMVKTQRPLLMFFTTPGCGYCVKMKAETFADQNVAKEVTRHFIAVQVDGRKYPTVAKQLRLRFYPTTAIVKPGGEVVEVVHGFKPAASFTKRLHVAKGKLQNPKLAAKSAAKSRN